MAADGDEFSALHVVSDLHLAGRGSSQIFKGCRELAELVSTFANDASVRPTALVINGDFVDFLAAREATYFDRDGAVSKLNDVVEEYGDVWAALGRFVSKRHARLVIVLGNHDLELSLPAVRRRLLESIAGNDLSAQARVQLYDSGDGFTATVLGQRVLCVHGNDVDIFNVVDHEHLLKMHRDGAGNGDWIPNAGTKLVIDVMNDIKRELPFVDLLKPETELVLPVLFALKQATRERLGNVLAVGSRFAMDKVRRGLGLLSFDEDQARPQNLGTRRGFDEFLLDTFPQGTELSNGRRAEALMRRAEQSFRDGRDPLDLIRMQREEQLGYAGAFRDAVRGKSREEILLQALERVQRDQSFDPLVPDDTFRALDRRHDAGNRVLIAGHTHLERFLRRSRGSGVYMNTGTWARLIRLRPDDLSSIERFAPVFSALQAKTMAELDLATPNRIIHRPSVASVWDENGSFRCALRRVRLANAAVTFDDVME